MSKFVSDASFGENFLFQGGTLSTALLIVYTLSYFNHFVCF
jgi:hypothetical protein